MEDFTSLDVRIFLYNIADNSLMLFYNRCNYNKKFRFNLSL